MRTPQSTPVRTQPSQNPTALQQDDGRGAVGLELKFEDDDKVKLLGESF